MRNHPNFKLFWGWDSSQYSFFISKIIVHISEQSYINEQYFLNSHLYRNKIIITKLHLRFSWYSNNGRNDSYFKCKCKRGWRIWSVIYCFLLRLNSKRIYNIWHIWWRKPSQLPGWVKISTYYSAIAVIQTFDLLHSMTLSKKFLCSYPL
jgi:hypothetical protein